METSTQVKTPIRAREKRQEASRRLDAWRTRHAVALKGSNGVAAVQGNGDCIAVSRKEYEAFMNFRKLREFSPTTAQRRALTSAERSFKNGKTLSYNELTRQLGFTG